MPAKAITAQIAWLGKYIGTQIRACRTSYEEKPMPGFPVGGSYDTTRGMTISGGKHHHIRDDVVCFALGYDGDGQPDLARERAARAGARLDQLNTR